MKARIVRLSDIAEHGGRLDARYYIDNEIGEAVGNDAKSYTIYVCPRCERAEFRDTMKHRLGMAGYRCACGHVPMEAVEVVRADDREYLDSVIAESKQRLARIMDLEDANERLLRAAAAALERCEVADDSSGAADEAAARLAQVVTLSGEYVPPEG